MKQKIVIEMSMKNRKSQSKAMMIAFGFSGVEKATVDAPGKDQMEVVGDGVDSVALVVLLHKRFGCAELLSVSAVEEKKAEPKKAEPKKAEVQYMHQYPAPPYLYNPYPYYPYPDYRNIIF